LHRQPAELLTFRNKEKNRPQWRSRRRFERQNPSTCEPFEARLRLKNRDEIRVFFMFCAEDSHALFTLPAAFCLHAGFAAAAVPAKAQTTPDACLCAAGRNRRNKGGLHAIR
jgi:hypothetical protein